MNTIVKYNLKTVAVSLAVVIVVMSLLSYTISANGERFLSRINPFSFIEGVVFALGFGLGFPVWLAIIVLLLCLFLLWLLLFWIARRVIR